MGPLNPPPARDGCMMMQGQLVGVAGNRNNIRSVADPYRYMILYALLMTKADISAGGKKRRLAKRFVASQWFETLCYGIGLDPDCTRDAIYNRENGGKR